MESHERLRHDGTQHIEEGEDLNHQISELVLEGNMPNMLNCWLNNAHSFRYFYSAAPLRRDVTQGRFNMGSAIHKPIHMR